MKNYIFTLRCINGSETKTNVFSEDIEDAKSRVLRASPHDAKIIKIDIKELGPAFNRRRDDK